MYKFLLLAASLVFATATVSAQDLESEPGQLGYALGYQYGSDLTEWDIDLEALIMAIRDASQGTDPRVAPETMQQVLGNFNQQLRQRRLEEFQRLAEENQQKSDEFFAENRNKTGISTLPSGVQYRIIEEGDGARPSPTDTVMVHLRAAFVDGLEFQSTFASGQPIPIQIDAVPLEGFKEVLPLMREGSTWQVFLPPEMAYGLEGDPPAIGPNQALKFDLQLVRIGVPEEQQRG